LVEAPNENSCEDQRWNDAVEREALLNKKSMPGKRERRSGGGVWHAKGKRRFRFKSGA
jgi:hypothetical protein